MPTCRGSRICSIRRPAAASRISARTRSIVRYPMRSFPSDLAIQAGAAQRAGCARRARSNRVCRWRRRASPRAARGSPSACAARRAQLAKDSRAPATTISPRISQPRDRRGGRQGRRSSSTNIRCGLDHCAREKPGTFFALGPGRRARLGPRRGARRQARRAGEAHRRDARRRRLHVRQSDGRPLGVGSAQAADPHRRLQQQPLRRRAPRHAVDVQGRRRRRGRWPHARRSRSVAAVRGNGARAGRAMPSASKSPPTCPTRWRARATLSSTRRKQALLNVITPY